MIPEKRDYHKKWRQTMGVADREPKVKRGRIPNLPTPKSPTYGHKTTILADRHKFWLDLG
jgi:hypothetical protein